jgi:hypothetical protein
MNNHHMGLKFWSNPSGGASGSAPDQAEVILIDEFGNYAAVNRVSVVIQSVALSGADPLAVTKTDRTDPSGIVTFKAFQLETAGKHILRTRFSHDQARCLASSEFFQRVVNVTRICNARSEATTGDDMTRLQMSSHFRSLHHPDDV